MFEKVDGVIKIYNRIRYLELSNSYDINYRIYNEIFEKINYFITEKRDDKHSLNHNFPETRTDSCNSLSIEKKLTFYNAIILIISVVSQYKNNYYYNIFSEKGSYKESHTQYF